MVIFYILTIITNIHNDDFKNKIEVQKSGLIVSS